MSFLLFSRLLVAAVAAGCLVYLTHFSGMKAMPANRFGNESAKTNGKYPLTLSINPRRTYRFSTYAQAEEGEGGLVRPPCLIELGLRGKNERVGRYETQ